MAYPFVAGERYRRRDVYRIIGIPENTKGGNWDTGYASHEGDYFIFCNVGTAGRTGHDYNNHWTDDDLHWWGKTDSHLNQPSIQALISPQTSTYVFYRTDSNSPFTFAGIGTAKQTFDTQPVQVLWSFPSVTGPGNSFPSEGVAPESYPEGARVQVWVNRYERSREARQKCLEHYGLRCSVCEMSLEDRYGAVGAGIIHVHHVIPVSELGEGYQLDPVADLRPLCPNCHAVLHSRTPPFGIEELKQHVFAK